MSKTIASDKEAVRREQRRNSSKRYYEQHREAVIERNKIKYEAKKDTEEWKEDRRRINKTYADKRKERLKQEKELLIKLQAQLDSLQ